MSDPLTWPTTQFGEDAAATLATIFRGCLRRAHQRALAAHLSGGLGSNDLYGTGLALAQHEELARAVEECGLEGAGSVKVLRYRLARLKNFVFYPVRYGDSATLKASDATLRRPVSSFRRTLFAQHGPEPAQTSIYDELDPADWGDAIFETAQSLGLDQDTKVITLAYAANPNAGLLRLFWGEAELTEDAHLSWHDRAYEEIPMLLEGAVAAGPTLRAVPGKQQERSFTQGAEPHVDLGMQTEREEEATGESAG